MAILRVQEIRKLEKKEIDKKLYEFKLEMAKEKANRAIGAAVSSPGRLKELRKSIARMETLKSQKGVHTPGKGRS